MIPHSFRRGAAALGAIAILAVVGCNDDEDTTAPSGSIGISLPSSSVTVARGATATLTVNLTRHNFTGPLTISVEGLPTGVSAQDINVGATETQAVISLVATSTATIGTKTVTIHVAGSGQTGTATFSLTVGGTSNFALNSTVASVTAAPGASATTTLSVARTSGFTDDVMLTVTGGPPGITTSLSAPALTTTTQTTDLRIDVGPTVTPGTYTLTVTGTSSNGGQQTETITVLVT